jgi:predicted NBD/HSP70 family sugar kinase
MTILRHPGGRADKISTIFIRNASGQVFSANEKRILNLVQTHDALSRADLARHTDLALQSVVRLVDNLVERGFLQAGEKVIKGPGQPSTPMSLVPGGAYTFGVSIMTDAISMLLMDLAGNVIAKRRQACDISDRNDVIAGARLSLDEMVAETGIDAVRLFGVGLSTTGYFVRQGEVNPPAAMADWALLNLEDELSADFGLPVWVENDGNAAAAGESLYGVGKRHKNFAYLYIATGLGGGLVIDGQLLRGFNGNAGEFTGILAPEIRASRPTLALLLEMVQQRGVDVASIHQLVEMFDPQWPGVEGWLERTRPALIAVLSAIAAVLDPEAIVIGGRVPRSLAQAMVDAASYYQSKLRGRERPFPTILVAEAEGDAAALGAAALPLKHHFFS